MPNWEVFTENKSNDRGKPMVARLVVGSEKKPARLYIGKKLVNAGFDTTARYELMFDPAEQLIGLKTSASGYKAGGANMPSMSMTGFVRKFNIQTDYQIDRFWRDGEIWVLPLITKQQSKHEKR